MMNRRRFLSLLAKSAAAVTVGAELDLDKLLWVQGTKKIFLPPVVKTATLAEIDAIVHQHWAPILTDLIFRDSPVFTRLKSGKRMEFRG